MDISLLALPLPPLLEKKAPVAHAVDCFASKGFPEPSMILLRSW